MKDKDGNNPEDILAQISNSRTQEPALISLFTKLKSVCLSDVQRGRALKLVNQHFRRGAKSEELQRAALEAGFAVACKDLSSLTSAASGAPYIFLETCRNIVHDYVNNENSVNLEVVSKTLEVLSKSNSATVAKLFLERDGTIFKKIITTCLRKSILSLHALSLLDVALSMPESEPLHKAVTGETVAIFPLVYPLLFDLEQEFIRDGALKVMCKLKLTSKPQALWSELKDKTQKIYSKQMVQMVNEKKNWPPIWQFVVNLFGEELNAGGQLINHMLEVLEKAFKHSDLEWTRTQAFECWKTLIDNFKSGLRNKKRIDLIMIPLKANNHRIETLALAKLKTYLHLVRALDKDLVLSPDILTSFISFCFGSEKMSIGPVKSYPGLHEMCAESLKEILMSQYIDELFVRAHKDIMRAIGDCFLMDNLSSILLSSLWHRLLDLVKNHEAPEIIRNLFYMIQKLVTQAGNGETSASFKFRQSLSPSNITNSPNEHLGSKIVLTVLNSLTRGDFALKPSILKSRSLYTGSYDVMTGTPAFLFLEWLLTPALMLGAGNSDEFKDLISDMISVRLEEQAGFMDYAQLVLKKLMVFDDALPANKSMLLYLCATNVWCTLAKKLVEYIQNLGSINQGNAAEHDFRALYYVLLFPVQNLFVDFKLIEMCSEAWSTLFYQACQQADLVPTASRQELCDQVCTRLASVSKRNKCPKQRAAVYCLLTCVLQVAAEKFKGVKKYQIQESVSSILKELDDLSTDQELVFIQCVACAQCCLQPNPGSVNVVRNVCGIISSLLNSKVNSYDPIDKLCSLIKVLGQAVLYIQQRGESKESVKTLLQNVTLKGTDHFSQKVRSCVWELKNIFEEKQMPTKEDQSPISTPNKLSAGSGFSPNSNVSVSPKQNMKRFAIMISPSRKSPGNANKKLQKSVSGSDVKFVRIETPPKKIVLTEHQKEVRRERRQDIPALYQDLSQDTQSMSQDASQDFVALPSSPRVKVPVAPDEDAVMDTTDVHKSIQILKVKSPKSVEKATNLLQSKSEPRDFTPPAGFVLTSAGSESLPSTEHQTGGKENENLSPRKRDVSPRSTRSSSNVNVTTTRSGKILKRSSLASTEAEPVVKRKSARKSLSCIEDLTKKSSQETITIESDTTDTESVSSLTSDASSTNLKNSIPRKKGRPRKNASQVTVMESALETEKEDTKKTSEPVAVDGNISKVKDNSEITIESSSVRNQEPVNKKPVPVGVKILKRLRSNLNLDDVVTPAMEQKETDKTITNSQGPKEISKKSTQQIEPLSPRQSSAKRKREDVNGGEKADFKGSSVVSPSNRTISPKSSDENSSITVSRKVSDRSENLGKKTDDSSKKMALALCSVKPVGKDGLKTLDSKNMDRSSALQISPMHTGNEDKHNGPRNVCSGLDCMEESQEIIESSQEPLRHKVKPCAVSLEPFLEVEPNKQVKIDNIVLVKGPESSSPYKVHPQGSLEVGAAADNSVRRALDLELNEKTESPSANLRLQVSENGTPLLNGGDQSTKKVSGVLLSSVPSTASSITSKVGLEAVTDALKEYCNGDKSSETSSDNADKEETRKDQNPVVNGEINVNSRGDCMPEWMHEKKNSPSNKPIRSYRMPSARNHIWMKSVKDVDLNTSPPKGIEMSPVSSPSQSNKKTSKLSGDSSSNTTPIIKGSSRAGKLLGLCQAAAARGGETVASSLRKSEQSEDSDVPTSNCSNAGSCNSSTNSNSANTPSTATVVASPSLQRKVLDLDFLKYTPQKCLEDKGLQEEWVPRTPSSKATPDSGILKRRREDDDVQSPSVKRKRVSFRDPPLSSLLRFGECMDTPGTVFSSEHSADSDKKVEPQEEEDSTFERSRAALQNENPVECKTSDEVAKSHKDDSLPNEDGRARVEDVSNRLSSEPKENCSNKETPPKGLSPVKNTSVLKDKLCSEMSKNGVVEDEMCGLDASEVAEIDTQGSIEDLHRTSSVLLPLYPKLGDCSHSVDNLIHKLTSAAWRKSLQREFMEKKILTVGDLAKLTEENLDRLSVKNPKKLNVCRILEEFEQQHSSLSDSSCNMLSLSKIHSAEETLKEVLGRVSHEEVLKTLDDLGLKQKHMESMLPSLQPQDIAAVISRDHSLLQSLCSDYMTAPDVLKQLDEEKASGLLDVLVSNVKKPSKEVKGKLISKLCPSDILAVLDEKKSDDLLNALVSNVKNPSKDLMEKLLPKMSMSDILELLNEKKSNDLLNAFVTSKKLTKHQKEQLLINILEIVDNVDKKKLDHFLEEVVNKVKEPSKHLKETVLSKMSAAEIVEKLGEKKANDTLQALLADILKPSKHLKEVFFSKMSSPDIVEELDQEKSNEILQALVADVIIPPKQVKQTLINKMSSSDIVEELDEKKSNDILQALIADVIIPPKQVRQTLINKMSSSNIVEELDQEKSNEILQALVADVKIPPKQVKQTLINKMSSSDIVEELDEKKSNDILQALVADVKIPPKQLKQTLINKMSSSDIIEVLNEKKANDLLEALVCNVKEPTKQLREVLLSKMSLLDIAAEFDQTKSEKLIKMLLVNIKNPTKDMKESLLSKISSSDIAASGCVKPVEVCRAVIPQLNFEEKIDMVYETARSLKERNVSNSST